MRPTDLRTTELRLWDAIANVAVQGKTETTTNGKAVNGSDNRLVHLQVVEI